DQVRRIEVDALRRQQIQNAVAAEVEHRDGQEREAGLEVGLLTPPRPIRSRIGASVCVARAIAAGVGSDATRAARAAGSTRAAGPARTTGSARTAASAGAAAPDDR